MSSELLKTQICDLTGFSCHSLVKTTGDNPFQLEDQTQTNVKVSPDPRAVLVNLGQTFIFSNDSKNQGIL